MNNDEVWILSTKSKVLDGSPLALDGSEFMFGECAVLSNTEANAKSQVEAALVNIKLQLVEITTATIFEESQWSASDEQSEEMLALANEAKSSRNVEFGMFRSSEYLDMDEK